MDTEPVTVSPPRPVRRPLLRQAWRDVALLHWRLDPELAVPLLPPGTRPDLYGRTTYVGIVPLCARRTGVPGLPAVPWLGTFGEVNVRLYSVDARGRRGVVFLRMDADRLVPVLTARAVPRLPYTWSRTRVHRDGDRHLTAVTDHSGGTRARIELRIGHRHRPTPLERFLAYRWGLHTRIGPRTAYLPVAHEPWVLHVAEPVELTSTLLADAGLPAPAGPPVSVLYSPGVDVRLGPPLLV